MAFTVDQLEELRTWLPWDPPTDVDLQARGDDLGTDSIYPTVVEQLRVQYTRLLMSPASFSIPGDWSQNTSENLKHLKDLISNAEGLRDNETLGESGLVVQRLVRANPYSYRAW